MKDIKKNKKKHSYGVTIFVFILLIVIMVYIYMLSDAQLYIDDMSFGEIVQQVTDSKSSFRGVDRILELVYGNDDSHGGVSGNSGGNLSNGYLGKYPDSWYIFMPIYEMDPVEPLFSVNPRDGGFGPWQATHSHLPCLVESLYNSDPTYYADLKPYVDNPLLYMKKCVTPHSWDSCKTYPEGSRKLRDVCMQYVNDNPRRWLNDCLSGYQEVTFMEPVIAKLTSITGKLESELSPGLVNVAHACYVRKQNNGIFNGCVNGMSDDELMQKINDNTNNGEARFSCQVELAQRLNAGQIDIYGEIYCNHPANKRQGITGANTWGKLFKMEGY